MRPWKNTCEGLEGLVDAFSTTDPCLPRPRLSSELYTAFRTGYLTKYPPDSVWLGEEFLRLIEAEQDERDKSDASMYVYDGPCQPEAKMHPV